jgi:hypothetical protein
MQKPIMFQMKIDCLSIRMEHRWPDREFMEESKN